MSKEYNTNELSKEKQNERFNEARQYLSEKGIKPKRIFDDIAEYLKSISKESNNTESKNAECDYQNREYEILSAIDKDKLYSYGKNVEPPIDFLEFLYRYYYINPDYIRCKQDWMVDEYAEFIDSLKKSGLFKGLDITIGYIGGIEHSNLPVIKMSSKLYDYLLAIDPNHYDNKKTVLSPEEREIVSPIYEKEKNKKKKKEKENEKKNEIQDYYLIPCKANIEKELLLKPVNFEARLSQLEEQYKHLEKQVKDLQQKEAEEINKITSEIYAGFNKLKRLSDEYKNHNKKNNS